MNELDIHSKKKPQQSTPESEANSGKNCIMEGFTHQAQTNDENSCFDAEGHYQAYNYKVYTMGNITEEALDQLQNELYDSKHKLKAVTQKFSHARKERDSLKRENKELQEEVLSLQSNIRQMVPGFSNTSCSFPMFNELLNKVS